jgi:hypothetical protein
MLRRSVIASGFLHVAVITAASVAWPMSFNLPDDTPPAIPVELITVADVTNVAPAMPDPPKPEPQPEQQPPPQPEAAPPPPEAEVAPQPDKLPVPKPAPEREQTAAAPAHPARPRLKPAPPQKFDVDSVLALLDKSTPQKPAPAPAAKPAEVPVRGLGAQDAFTVDLKDALLSQMRQCWNVPVGAPEPEKLIVQVRVFLTPEGDLARPPQLEPGTRTAVAANPYMRAAAEAALRAVNVCEPYKHLPPEKYEVWREIVMTFDPSKMIGR